LLAIPRPPSSLNNIDACTAAADGDTEQEYQWQWRGCACYAFESIVTWGACAAVLE